jgi:hypothetical protein
LSLEVCLARVVVIGLEASCEPSSWSDNVIEARVGRLQHTQQVYEVGIAAKIPPTQTPISGRQMAGSIAL